MSARWNPETCTLSTEVPTWEAKQADGSWRRCAPPQYTRDELEELDAQGVVPVMEGRAVKTPLLNVSVNAPDMMPKGPAIAVPVHPAAFREVIGPDDGSSPDLGMFIAPNGMRYPSRSLARSCGHMTLQRSNT